MAAAEVLAGEFSQLGRSTGRTIQKLKSCYHLEPGVEAPVAPSSVLDGQGGDAAHSPKSLSPGWRSAKLQLSVASTFSGALGARSQSTGTLMSPASPASPMGRTRSQGLATTSCGAIGGSQPAAGSSPGARGPDDERPALTRRQRIALGEELPAPKAVPARLSPAFTSLGQDTARYCGNAGAMLGRFAFPVTLEEKPEVGRYQPSHAMVHDRLPSWQFGEHPKHHSRKVEDLDITVRDPFGHQDMNSPAHSFAATGGTASGVEQMQVLSPRRGVEKSQSRTYRDSIMMHEASKYAREWCLQDVPSSRRPRQPRWDFQHLQSRGPTAEENYFEPGKCITYSALSPPAKAGVPFIKALDRAKSSSGLVGHTVPKSVLQPPGVRLSPDRSLHRDSPHTRPRVTHVLDFSTELGRPPLTRPSTAPYDEEDLEASAAWLQRSLAYDGASADRATIPRHDHAPAMARALARGGCRGARLFESDMGMLKSLGRSLPESDSQLQCSVERAKEVPSRPRPDQGVKAFGQYCGRAPTRICGEYSSLRRPRCMAAPDFERRTRAGFATKARMHQVRSPHVHGALPAWAVECCEKEEGVDVEQEEEEEQEEPEDGERGERPHP